MMYEMSDRTADLMVEVLSAEAAKLRSNAGRLPWAANASTRRSLRTLADDMERAIAGINTGEGVTRGSAVR